MKNTFEQCAFRSDQIVNMQLLPCKWTVNVSTQARQYPYFSKMSGPKKQKGFGDHHLSTSVTSLMPVCEDLTETFIFKSPLSNKTMLHATFVSSQLNAEPKSNEKEKLEFQSPSVAWSSFLGGGLSQDIRCLSFVWPDFD